MMFFKFSEEAQKLLLLSLKEKNKLNDSFIGTEHIFLAALSMKNSSICKILNDNNIYYDEFISYLNKKDVKDKTSYYIFTPLMSEIFNSLSNNHSKKNSEVLVSEIITEILNNSNAKALLILKKMNVEIKKIYKMLNATSKKKTIKKGFLNDVGVNLNEKFGSNREIVLERDEEINRIIEILCCKNKNNPLLIGDAGVGKTAIVEELARRIQIGDIPYKLKNKKIYSIAMASLVAGTKYRGEFEEKINKLIAEVESSDDVILFIDEIHTLVGAGGADGAIDASNILKPYLARGNIKVIGATTKDEYKKFFMGDKALNRRFQIVNISEPNIEQVEKILLGIKPIYEEYHNVKISDDIIKKIIYYSDKYINNRKFPDKAIDILDEVCVMSSIFYNKEYNSMINLDKDLNQAIDLKNKSLINGDYKQAIKYSHDEKNLQQKIGRARKNIFNNKKTIEVSEEILLKVIQRKTNIPFYTYKYEKNKLLKEINNYNQDSIFSDKVMEEINNFTLNLYDNLINNCLFKSLFIRSNNYGLNNYFIDSYLNKFFKDINIIHLDISNFRNIDDLLRDNEFNNKNNTFIDQIKNNLYSVVVIDNLNDADYSIYDFLNRIDKYGYYVNRDNEKINFSNVLFIYNTLVSDKIGFNNSSDDGRFYIDLNDICRHKLYKKLKNICMRNNYQVSSKFIDGVVDKILNNKDNWDNIEFLIKKEVSNLDNNYNKSKTIKV